MAGLALLLLPAFTAAGCRPHRPAGPDRREALAGPPTSRPASTPSTASAGGATTTGAPDPAADARAAVKTAQHFAAAIAAGDVAAAKSMMHAPTKAHGLLAEVVVRQFIAYHRIRAAAVKPLGPTEARRLPMNDAGTFFRYRMAARVNGNKAVVAWRDDCGEDGSEREIELVRVEGSWLVSPAPPDAPAGEVYREVGGANTFLRQLERVAADVEEGRLATFEQINDAF